MTTTLNPTEAVPGSREHRGPAPQSDPSGSPGPTERGHARWPLFGAVGAVAAFASVIVSMPTLTEEEYATGVRVIDELERGGYHLGFLLGLVSVGCLWVASSGWKRWAEQRVPDSLAGRTLAQGLAATATINVIFTCLMGSMALYLPGGTDEGWLSDQAIFTNFTLLDFGTLLGWWGAAVSAICVAVLAFGKTKALPRWMGVVSVVLLLPPFLMAIPTGLPGFVGFTMPIWLLTISIGMVFSRKAQA
ncbi:MAG TPA: hypothetical protein VNS19_02190 [Acidimicrobiales bacterium]|nr:hypothetical protein [Acidimicrobiales bacterium]